MQTHFSWFDYMTESNNVFLFNHFSYYSLRYSKLFFYEVSSKTS